MKYISKVFKKKHYKKGTIIFEQNDVADEMLYIYEGCLRTVHLDDSGKEHTIQFAIKDWWITDYISYFTNTKAYMTLEALEDTTVYSLTKADKELFYTEISKVQSFIIRKLEAAYAAFQKRIIVNLSQSAKDRYLTFLDTHSEIEKKLKNYHIASYLGITTESLSRIRKELYNS
nr:MULTISPECIES: Crp/Fnr family transcriptional regulator [Winogradskyella]